MRRATAMAIGLAATLCASAANAHLMPAQQGTLNVVDDAVFAVFSVPTAALRGVDDDGDGALDQRELGAHEADIREQLDRRIAIRDGDTRAATQRLDFMLSPQHEGAQDRATQLIVLEHVTFARPPRSVAVDYDLFGVRTDERWLTIAASRRVEQRSETESATLSADSRSHVYFSAGAPRPAVGRTDLFWLLGLAALFGAMQWAGRALARRRAPMSEGPRLSLR